MYLQPIIVIFKHVCAERNILPGSQWLPWLNVISAAQLSVCIWARGETDKNNQTFVLPCDFWKMTDKLNAWWGRGKHLTDLCRHQKPQPSDGGDGSGATERTFYIRCVRVLSEGRLSLRSAWLSWKWSLCWTKTDKGKRNKAWFFFPSSFQRWFVQSYCVLHNICTFLHGI